MSNSAGGLAVAALLLASPLLAQRPPNQSQNRSQPRDALITVNGIRLHYVDWGGRGQTLLLLTGLGGDGHGFDSFAPRFTGDYHVLVLTRRGQGQSDKPASGYDLDTLAADIGSFLDALRIEEVNLAGHSIAGAEMTGFAIAYPRRVRKLVYLDAAFDYAVVAAIMAEAKFVPMLDRTSAAIQAGAAAVHPDYGKITAPALAFFTVIDHPLLSGLQDPPEYKQYLRLLVEHRFVDQQIERFRTGMKDQQVILISDAMHATFLDDPKYADDVAREMRAFLTK